jgi:hypothetical protein
MLDLPKLLHPVHSALAVPAASLAPGLMMDRQTAAYPPARQSVTSHHQPFFVAAKQPEFKGETHGNPRR